MADGRSESKFTKPFLSVTENAPLGLTPTKPPKEHICANSRNGFEVVLSRAYAGVYCTLHVSRTGGYAVRHMTRART